MANETLVSYGKPKVGGAVNVAPTGTTLPTNATTALDAAFKNLGYISEDGLTHNNTPTSEIIKAWGGDTVLSLQTDREDTFTFVLIEVLNTEVLKLIHGAANVTGSLQTGIAISANNTDLAESAMVVEMVLKGGVIKRIVIPKGKITEIGEMVYNDSEAAGYEVTVTAASDSTGNTHYEYILNPNMATELATLTVTGGASASGNLTITLDGVAKTVAVLNTDTTVDAVAAKVRGTAYPGWVTGGTNGVVTFTATTTGIKTDAVFAAASTGVVASMVTTRQGA